MKLTAKILLLAVVAASCAAALRAMDNEAVIKMRKSGLADDTIIMAIRKEKPEYDTSADALVALKEAGVSEAVIQAMLQPAPAATAAAPVVARDEVFHGDFPSIAPPMVKPVVGQNYFTRFTLHQEEDEYETTNYARGELVPINTPVKVVSIGKKEIMLKRLDNGRELEVENQDKYTRKTAAEFASLLLSSGKTPIEQLPAKVADAVTNGEMRKGMTKELVLMARGYPPAHETPSLDQDRWTYWSSRFVKQTIVFADGRLSEGREID